MKKNKKEVKQYIRKEVRSKHSLNKKETSQTKKEMKFFNNIGTTVFFAVVLAALIGVSMIDLPDTQKITANVVQEVNILGGCCEDVCQQGQESECSGTFHPGAKCGDIQQCLIGCCIDREGYCLTNYLQGNCFNRDETFVSNQCDDIAFCKFVTNKPIVEEATTSVSYYAPESRISSNVIYAGDSITIEHQVYDDTFVKEINAFIRNGDLTIGSVELFDDGNHRDGIADDLVYGNFWASPAVSLSNKVTTLTIDVVVTHTDGSTETMSNTNTFGILTNNRCYPIRENWIEPPKEQNVVFAAQNYGSYETSSSAFENDVNSFMFSLSLIQSKPIDTFSFYRIDKFESHISPVSSVSFATNECLPFQSGQDVIIVLDKDAETCTEEVSYIKTHPNSIFRDTVNDMDLSKSIEGLCDHILTETEFVDLINGFLTIPTIDVSFENNEEFNVNTFNISFSVEDGNYPDNYIFFFDGVAVQNGTVLNSSLVYVTLENIENGEHSVQVEVENANSVVSFTDLLRIIVNSITT